VSRSVKGKEKEPAADSLTGCGDMRMMMMVSLMIAAW